MDNKETEKPAPKEKPKAVTKSFMTVGPTLHYSHKNVQICFSAAVVIFGLSCFLWSRLVTGTFWSFNFQDAVSPASWRLDRFVLSGASIFEFPWQILVLGLLMGIMAAVPVLVSQLMSFSYSFIFILEVFFLANLPGFAICLLISCIAAACRPLRFRSRIIAVALCTAPQILYWGYFGGARGVEPIKWGFSFTPWICAWLAGLAICGAALGIGHFTRYRPGIIWSAAAVALVLAVVVFVIHIGLNELDYQFYVAENNPENVTEFHDHSITEALDRTITNPAVRRYLQGFFYPTEPIPLREEVKNEIQIQLARDSWPTWFVIPDQLRYQIKKQWLNQQYELFINPPRPWWMPVYLYDEFVRRRSTSKRMLIALYYKAILAEYAPDINLLGQKEVLHFYSDYPYERAAEYWYRLYQDFGGSPESLEARWRIAMHWAGLGRFAEADELLAGAQTSSTGLFKRLAAEQSGSETIFSPFQPPADSVMTESKLTDLQRRISQTRLLISAENQIPDRTPAPPPDRIGGQVGGELPDSQKRLARFVMLNPHSQDYSRRLAELLRQMSDTDPLRDNVLLAQIKLISDEQMQAKELNRLHDQFQQTDGGMQALYELGLLKRRQWSQQNESNLELKRELLAETQAILTSFISLYPNSLYTEQVEKNLTGLPKVE